MIKNPALLEKLERNIIANENLSFIESLNIFEAMWQEGVSLGVLPPKEPLEGIDVDIRIAKILCSENSSQK
ncbi:hypothetical protein KAW65_07530 [candidate division WOR-3 bacterium]|nr:hypothetical protein [candidate division WOR-3 bacterium]